MPRFSTFSTSHSYFVVIPHFSIFFVQKWFYSQLHKTKNFLPIYQKRLDMPIERWKRSYEAYRFTFIINLLLKHESPTSSTCITITTNKMCLLTPLSGCFSMQGVNTKISPPLSLIHSSVRFTVSLFPPLFCSSIFLYILPLFIFFFLPFWCHVRVKKVPSKE